MVQGHPGKDCVVFMYRALYQCNLLCFLMVLAAALALRGADAQLNFPSMASTLPRPVDLADKSIQAAAIKAAQTFSKDRKRHSSSTHNSRSQTSTKSMMPKSAAQRSDQMPIHVPSSSGNSTEVELCGPVSQPIRECQETVSSCEDHFERVSNYSSESTDFITSDAEMECTSAMLMDGERFMYTTPELQPHSAAIDSDEGAMSNAWEPRLWSF